MRTHHITGTIQRKFPVRSYNNGVFNTQVISVITVEKDIYFFKAMAYGRDGKTGNLHLIYDSQPDDVVKVGFKINCKTTKQGVPMTDLLIETIETIDPIGQKNEEKRKQAVKEMRENNRT